MTTTSHDLQSATCLAVNVVQAECSPRCLRVRDVKPRSDEDVSNPSIAPDLGRPRIDLVSQVVETGGYVLLWRQGPVFDVTALTIVAAIAAVEMLHITCHSELSFLIA